MSKYVLRRLLLLIPTLIGMSLLIFIMLRLLPGDVVDLMTGGDIPASAERSRRCARRSAWPSRCRSSTSSGWAAWSRATSGKSLRTREPISAILLRSAARHA